MGREELIACFQDTLEIANSRLLKGKTAKAIKSNKVYVEGFCSKKQTKGKCGDVLVEADTSFHSVRKYLQFGRVAVLNFANPHYPGGGVQNGAMAQEECLCRSSNLYPCISDENVFEHYYQYNRNIQNYFFSDRLIYTKDVTVFKDDASVPKLMPENEWFDVDVISCAAPYLEKRKYTNMAALLELLKGRIKNIFEAAKENDVDVIILGAFGCGAFKNPPHLMAQAFRNVIDSGEYQEAFRKIIFAIKPTGNPCPNFEAFFDELRFFFHVKVIVAKSLFSRMKCEDFIKRLYCKILRFQKKKWNFIIGSAGTDILVSSFPFLVTQSVRWMDITPKDTMCFIPV